MSEWEVLIRFKDQKEDLSQPFVFVLDRHFRNVRSGAASRTDGEEAFQEIVDRTILVDGKGKAFHQNRRRGQLGSQEETQFEEENHGFVWFLRIST